MLQRCNAALSSHLGPWDFGVSGGGGGGGGGSEGLIVYLTGLGKFKPNFCLRISNIE